MKPYSERLKHSLAAKILTPGGPSALSLSHETGISQTALSKWARMYKFNGVERMKEEQRRPRDWSRSERLGALVNSHNLKGSALGVFLRKAGLTTAHLSKWEQEFTHGTHLPKVGRRPKDPEVKSLVRENKSLKRDLRRKDKALAEASALLILKKKAQEIWGKDEDEE